MNAGAQFALVLRSSATQMSHAITISNVPSRCEDQVSALCSQARTLSVIDMIGRESYILVANELKEIW